MICFTGYLRDQSKLAKDAGAEEFKLTGGKGTAYNVMKDLPLDQGECINVILSLIASLYQRDV